MYNYYQPQYPPKPCLKGYQVSSVEEVRAAPIDFDGSIFYFPDIINNKIYTKSIGVDGTVRILSYNLQEPQQQLATEYVTKEDLQKSLENFRESLQSAKLEKMR